MPEKFISRPIIKFADGKNEQVTDLVVREFPLTLFVNEIEIATVVCTPNDLRELGVGFLLSEGLIFRSNDIIDMECQEREGLLNVRISSSIKSTDSFLRRNIASCCGKGRAGLYFINDARQVKAVDSSGIFQLEFLREQMAALERKSEIFKLTGGVHSAALAGKSLLLMYDDIGRHNAVDKVFGAMILQNINTDNKCLILSGRVSSEIVIKAARANIPLILSRAAPTDLAIDLAEELGISLIGFVRENKLNIYSHSERVR
ncbi:MAG: formate dehydrogenase accessory sulfurtransferase FdhD [Dehalobacterium sp.]